MQQLRVDKQDGLVAFTLQVPYSVAQRQTLNPLHFFVLQLTTPACPVKEQFKQWCRQVVTRRVRARG